jgi:hypothetical protein
MARRGTTKIQTTDLGVRGSTPLGRAKIGKHSRIVGLRRQLPSMHIAITRILRLRILHRFSDEEIHLCFGTEVGSLPPY